MRPTRPTVGRARTRSIPPASPLVAAGDGVDPWQSVPDGDVTSVLPVPRLFPDVAACAGYPATRGEDLIARLRIMRCHGVDGRLRIAPDAMVRLCAEGKAILDDIATSGSRTTPGAAASVVAVPPSVI